MAVSALWPEITGVADQVVTLGQSVAFSIIVTNGDGPFSYQWQFNGINLLNATNASYSLASVEFADLGAYSVIVTGLGRSASQSATLTANILPAFMTLGSATSTNGGLQLAVQLTGSTNYPYIL